ncbi:MAG: hypothetical protein EOL87_04135 [Spartobacteria bacterium]|nr:hypothetical protein [Spartobacteria bacterium]
MKTKRIKRSELAYYHCMTRVVGRDMILGDIEKELLRLLIRKTEAFTGVRVLTYALMTNHIHLLLEEPDRDTYVPENILIERMHCLYDKENMAEILARWAQWTEAGNRQAVLDDQQRYRCRMHDISEFMKQVKQRFSCWYNRCHHRRGTLWEERFKSILIEDGEALHYVSAYIDMNPVRAKIVIDPKDYRFCGFGEAMGGSKVAQSGITALIHHDISLKYKDTRSWQSVSNHYHEHVLMYDEVRNNPALIYLDMDTLREKMKKRLHLSDAERLMCTSRFFIDGQIMGSRAFVETYFEMHRNQFSPDRRSGARKVKGGWNNLYTLRELAQWNK